MNGPADIAFLRRVLLVLIVATLASGGVTGVGLMWLPTQLQAQHLAAK